MNWYLVKMVFRIDCGGKELKTQFEEQIRLIEAADAEAAFEKGCQIALDETNINPDTIDQKIRWRFVNLSELYRITSYLDGAEIYSGLNETDNGELFEKMIHRKAKALKQNIKQRILDIY